VNRIASPRVPLFIATFCAVAAAGCSKPPPREGFVWIRPPGDTRAIVFGTGSAWTCGKDGYHEIDLRTRKLVADWELPYARDLEMDDRGSLWIAHIKGLMKRSPDGKTEDLTDKLPNERANCVYQDSKKRIWVGTWGGVAVLEHGKWRHYTKRDGLIDDMVNVVFEDSKGRMWFGSYVAPKGGVSLLTQKGRWLAIDPSNGLPHPNVTAFAETAEGVWVATGLHRTGGAALLKPEDGRIKVVRRISRKTGLPGAKVRALRSDTPDGSIWLGFEYDGLAILSKEGSIRTFSKRDGLCDPEVKCIVRAPDGAIWLGTRDGITIMDGLEQ